jgi:hypothetical protein
MSELIISKAHLMKRCGIKRGDQLSKIMRLPKYLAVYGIDYDYKRDKVGRHLVFSVEYETRLSKRVRYKT